MAIALDGAALNLGRAKGVVWIGRPLDVTIPISVDLGGDASAVCATADVFHADNQVGPQNVNVTIEPGPNRSEARVRVRSSVLVDEPVVTVYLKAGCDDKSTRRFVLLSEVPLDYSAQPPISGGQGAVVVRPPISGAAPSGVVSPTDTGAPPRRAKSADQQSSDQRMAAAVTASRQKPAARESTEGAKPPPKPVRSVVRKPESSSKKARSRLKLDPIDLLAERDPILRASTEMLTVTADGEARRAQAAALWKAINASPEDIIRDAQRLDALQADVNTLRAQSQKSQTALLELKTRVEKAQSERYANNLVYALLAALLVALGAAAYFWNRSRNQVPAQWWGPEADEVNSDGPGGGGAGLANQTAAPESAIPGGLDIDLGQEDLPAANPKSAVVSASLAAARTAALGAYDGSDFQSSLAGAGRAVKVEELFDLQQQADFFISLGQYEQAAETLRNHISDSDETSAVAYLDLLKIYHLQGHQKDYDLVRKEFNDVFNAEVPEFDAFGLSSRGLESYEAAMSRIVALWPSAKVLDVIEESIFRRPGQGTQSFDLEAYRELLLLYAIAREVVETKGRGPAKMVVQPDPDPFAPFDFPESAVDDSDRPKFQATAIQPLAAARPYLAEPGMPTMRVPPSPNLGLDIDLSLLDELDAPSGTASKAAEVRVEPVALTPEQSLEKPRDSHVIDFDLFEMAEKAHKAKKKDKP